jgi:DNA-directed RNA polymerase specialized sigma subunit
MNRIAKQLSDYNWITECIEKSNKEIEICNDTIAAARELSGIDYSSESIGDPNAISDMTFQAVIRIEKIKESLKKWNERLENLYTKQHQIYEWLDLLNDIERDIIRNRYIKNMNWERIETSMNYSQSYCRKISTKAIIKLETYETNKKEQK